MLYIKLFIEREKNIGQSAPECPFKYARYTLHTIRYDTVYLTCSKKLTDSQLSLPHGMNKKCKRKTKNKLMSVISSVQSHYHEGSQMSKEEKLRWEGFVEKIC